MKLSFVILSLVICAVLAQTPLPTGNAWVTSSAAPSATTPVFEVPNTGFNDFVIQVVRTNTQSYDKGVGDGDYNVFSFFPFFFPDSLDQSNGRHLRHQDFPHWPDRRHDSIYRYLQCERYERGNFHPELQDSLLPGTFLPQHLLS